VGRWCSNEVHESYGVGLWKNIWRLGGCFLFVLDLKWVMSPRLDFAMTCGVGIRFLRKLSRICIVLLALRMLLWWITWSCLMTLISRI
jgi:hypothetical protein